MLVTLRNNNRSSRHWRDSRSRENLERKWSIFFYLELENWIFISRDVLEYQDFEEKILVLLSKFEILKKILFHFSKEWDFANRFSFSSRFSTQCLFQFSWEIIFCSLGWFWPSVFCRKGKYFKKTVLCCWAIFWLQFTSWRLLRPRVISGSILNGCPVERAYAKHARMRLTWLESEDQRRRRRDWFFLLYVFDIGYNKMDNYCTARLMIIALWWWYCQTHNLCSGFERQNSSCGEDLILRF